MNQKTITPANIVTVIDRDGNEITVDSAKHEKWTPMSGKTKAGIEVHSTLAYLPDNCDFVIVTTTETRAYSATSMSIDNFEVMTKDEHFNRLLKNAGRII